MSTNSRIVKIGEVGVDSGQLMICDPSYIDGQWENPDSEGKEDHAHEIYRNKEDGKLWQYTYEGGPATEEVNPFPASYADEIPEYGLSPNELKERGLWEKTDLDPTPHIPLHEFSFRGICKTLKNEDQSAQLNYLLGHPGAAVAFRSGIGDGTYDVYAELVDAGMWGERVKKVWVELITDEELEQMRQPR